MAVKDISYEDMILIVNELKKKVEDQDKKISEQAHEILSLNDKIDYIENRLYEMM